MYGVVCKCSLRTLQAFLSLYYYILFYVLGFSLSLSLSDPLILSGFRQADKASQAVSRCTHTHLASEVDPPVPALPAIASQNWL